MDWIWIAAVVLVFIVLAIASRRKKQPIRVSLFRQRDALFSPAERSFLGVLDQPSAGRYRIFGNVRIADVIALEIGPDKSAWTRSPHFVIAAQKPSKEASKSIVEIVHRYEFSAVRGDLDFH